MQSIFYTKKDKHVSIAFLFVILVTFPMYFLRPSVAISRQQLALVKPAAMPVATQSANSDHLLASLSATALYVSDEASGVILLAKNQDLPLYPASTTKLLTALVAREAYYLDQVLTVKQEAFTLGNTMGLLPGEQLSVNQLLHGLLIVSANDAAFVLANNHPQGYQGFVSAMNQKASQLGLTSSLFTNPSGLDAFEQQVSAHDLAIVAREAFKDDVLRQIMQTKEGTAQNVTASVTHPLTHTHELLFSDSTVVGGKTGTTDAAGQVLVTKFLRLDQDGDAREVIVAILGSQDRYAETSKVVDWVFANYHWQQIEL